MSLEGVTRIETEAGYGRDDQQTLRGVKLVWEKLSNLRRQAIKNDKLEGQYRDFLVKALAQGRARHPVEDVEDRSMTFWRWYDERCRELKISEREVFRGGQPHQAWSQRWLPAEYEGFEQAVAKVVDDPSELHFQALEEAAMKMLKRYVGAFDG